MRTRMLVLALVAGVLGTVSPAPASAAAPTAKPHQPRPDKVISKTVAFSVRNTNTTSVLCAADGRTYELRGRLVGTRAAVNGRTGAQRMNILVHDFAAGSWFWHLRERPAFDYATRLAKQGELSLVLDRLGYDGSPLADGRGTCLGAQADMLHQVVQHVRSGSYSFAGDRRKQPVHAARVVLQGHAVGAAIAQLEAGTYDDVDGLVLMSWTDSTTSTLARNAASAQVSACLRGAGYASYGSTDEDYRSLLFRTATSAVQGAALRLRNPDPCGDVTSLGGAALPIRAAAGDVDAPVLLLYGDQDAQLRPGAAEAQAGSYASDVAVTARTVAGAASALPLEATARATRGLVLEWLRSTY